MDRVKCTLQTPLWKKHATKSGHVIMQPKCIAQILTKAISVVKILDGLAGILCKPLVLSGAFFTCNLLMYCLSNNLCKICLAKLSFDVYNCLKSQFWSLSELWSSTQIRNSYGFKILCSSWSSVTLLLKGWCWQLCVTTGPTLQILGVTTLLDDVDIHQNKVYTLPSWFGLSHNLKQPLPNMESKLLYRYAIESWCLCH